jgi:hypothetical protein
MTLTENAVEWHGLALLDLATGISVAEVQDKLTLGEPLAAAEERGCT